MTISVHADELRPGDVVDYHGRSHRITGVSRCAGWAWPIAIDGTGWAIALDHSLVRITRA
jgi:hypothetical protein